jgi:hypothetical protein
MREGTKQAARRGRKVPEWGVKFQTLFWQLAGTYLVTWFGDALYVYGTYQFSYGGGSTERARPLVIIGQTFLYIHCMMLAFYSKESKKSNSPGSAHL